MTMRRNTLILAVAAATLSAAVWARPVWHGGTGHERGLHFLDMMADEIGLTMQQEEAINELVDEAALASAMDRERTGQIREALQRLSQADDGFDSASAAALADELAGLVSRGALSAAELRWQVRQVLTPEQRRQLDAVRRGRHAPPFLDAVDPLME